MLQSASLFQSHPCTGHVVCGPGCNWLSGRIAFWLPQLLFLLSELVPPHAALCCCYHPPRFSPIAFPALLRCCASSALRLLCAVRAVLDQSLRLSSVRCERLRSAARLLLSMRCAMSWLLGFMMRPWNALSKVNCRALFRCDHVPQCPVRPCASRSSVRARQHNTRAHRRGSDLIVLIDAPTKSTPKH